MLTINLYVQVKSARTTINDTNIGSSKEDADDTNNDNVKRAPIHVQFLVTTTSSEEQPSSGSYTITTTCDGYYLLVSPTKKVYYSTMVEWSLF
mmetsp:Transcript_40126/g.40656  ORF Transcript_40126/g.40656 Transcript_40126/m.40656 type:complete len:93 (+) Transcript_40126:785-1063(+)